MAREAAPVVAKQRPTTGLGLARTVVDGAAAMVLPQVAEPAHRQPEF